MVIGVHAPEFAFEKNIENVEQRGRRPQDRLSGRDRQRLRDLARLQQPILAGALFHRRQGPHPPPPFRRGRLRRIRRRVIQQLLAEAGKSGTSPRTSLPSRRRAPRRRPTRTTSSRRRPISAIDAGREFRFARRRGRRRAARLLRRRDLELNEWALAGDWTVGERERGARQERRRASSIASTPATCIWCWGRARTASRCASASRSTARRPARATAPTSTPTARAS